MKGLTYFDKSYGFSINEGEFPNIHVCWCHTYGVYVAISHRFKWWYFWTPSRTVEEDARREAQELARIESELDALVIK